MPIFQPHSLLIAQIPLAETGQMLLVMGLAFAVITLISSTYRFHRMVQLSDKDLVSIEDCNDFFFIQVTRYLSKINRRTSGFGIMIVEFKSDASDVRQVQEQLAETMRRLIRGPTDQVCLYQTHCAAAIVDTEESNVGAIGNRLAGRLQEALAGLPGISAFRTGISAFPLHGGNTRELVDAALAALQQTSFDDPLPAGIAPSPEMKDQGTPDEIGELSRQDKHSSLDPLTGVLSPAVIGSYMRKYFAEIRRRKEPAALLCVGITGIDNLIALQGEEAADAVIAGVSRVLQRLTRENDLIGRYHRDDFMILSACNLEQGSDIALRLHEAVQKETFLYNGRRIKAAVSIGVAGHPEHGRNLRDLFHGAYRALDVLRGWNTSACLVYDPARHDKKEPKNGVPA